MVGLDGSGDDNFAYLTQAMRGVSGRLGLQLPPGVNPALKNAAAVIITADLPAFAKPGQRIDVTVSTMGKAKSLRGGALIMTPLYGADGQVYAMAQGNLAVGGLGVSGQDGSKLTVNVPTVGRIADGATVEAAVASNFDFSEVLRWNLFQADFMTMTRVRDAINAAYPGMARIDGKIGQVDATGRIAPDGQFIAFDRRWPDNLFAAGLERDLLDKKAHRSLTSRRRR